MPCACTKSTFCPGAGRCTDFAGNPKGVPKPSREELRAAKPPSAHAILLGSPRGFPNPPAKSSARQSRPPLTRSSVAHHFPSWRLSAPTCVYEDCTATKPAVNGRGCTLGLFVDAHRWTHACGPSDQD